MFTKTRDREEESACEDYRRGEGASGSVAGKER